jgi:IMP dehydrogenase
MFQKAYTFDDVALVPQYNTIKSRTDPVLYTWLTKNIRINNPLIPANMDTVISFEMAKVIVDNGSIPIFHRFCTIEEQIDFCKKFQNRCFVSCGLNDYEKLDELYKYGALGVCIDVAHGHCEQVISLIKKLKSKYPEKDIIAGNVCTTTGYSDLVFAGADAVKVGVGPGAACSTRMVTGFGIPQFSAIYEISKIAKSLKIPIIADGGIRNSRDVALALAAGASCCMIGSLFSKTYESAGDKFIKNKTYNNSINKDINDCINNTNNINKKIKDVYDTEYIKIHKSNIHEYIDKQNNTEQSFNYVEPIYTMYRGQASKNFQTDYYGSMKKGIVPEGVCFYSLCSGTTQMLIDELTGGLRSALTYSGSLNIKEFQKNAVFVEVTNTYMSESNPRKNQ